MRFLPGLGGNGLRYAVEIMNDSGSNILSVFYEDLNQLGVLQLPYYYGWLGNVGITTADGNVEYLQSLLVEIRFLRPATHEPWGPWITESAIVRHIGPEAMRLSGRAMRDFMFFGTRAGNHHLAVADTKGGMSAII